MQILSMRLLPPIRRIHRRPCSLFGRAGQKCTANSKDCKPKSGPFAHDFRHDEARVCEVDDNFARFLGGAGQLGEFLGAIHFEQFGNVVAVVHAGFFGVGEVGEDGRVVTFGKERHPEGV